MNVAKVQLYAKPIKEVNTCDGLIMKNLFKSSMVAKMYCQILVNILCETTQYFGKTFCNIFPLSSSFNVWVRTAYMCVDKIKSIGHSCK